jgi:hypothetical protein
MLNGDNMEEILKTRIKEGLLDELCQKFNIQGETKSEKLRNLLDHFSKFEERKANNQLTLEECLDKLDFDLAVLSMGLRELQKVISDIEKDIIIPRTIQSMKPKPQDISQPPESTEEPNPEDTCPSP